MEGSYLRRIRPRHHLTTIDSQRAKRRRCHCSLVIYLLTFKTRFVVVKPTKICFKRRLLRSERDPIPDVPAIYFIAPTAENIARLCQVGL